MQNRTPVKRADRPGLPEFAPVPRKTYRHDGWTPERQKAFIEALADRLRPQITFLQKPIPIFHQNRLNVLFRKAES